MPSAQNNSHTKVVRLERSVVKPFKGVKLSVHRVEVFCTNKNILRVTQFHLQASFFSRTRHEFYLITALSIEMCQGLC